MARRPRSGELGPEIVRLARRIGVNLDDPRMDELLRRAGLNSYEAGELLGIDHASILAAKARGSLLGRDLRAGEGMQTTHDFRPVDVLRYGAARRGVRAFVDPWVAYLYAVEDKRVAELPASVREAGAAREADLREPVLKPEIEEPEERKPGINGE